MTPSLVTGADLFGAWLANVERAEPPKRYDLPPPFAALDVRPGRMILFAAPPGAGKTAAAMQVGTDLLRRHGSARVLVANVEMPPDLLLERVAARLSAVPLTAIQNRALTPDQLARVRAAVASLAPAADRLAFLNPPYTLEHVAAAGTVHRADVLILDYVQRFAVGDGSKPQREQLEAAVSVLRRFCDQGAAVLGVCAVARQKGANGSTYRGLNLASFRGSSELEFGCDAAYILVADGAGGVIFRCEKNRYGVAEDIPTAFDPARMTFDPAASGVEAFDSAPPAPPRRTRGKGE